LLPAGGEVCCQWIPLIWPGRIERIRSITANIKDLIGVTPWTDLPLWVPASNPSFTGFYNININKALKAGLSFRPLSKTVNDTLTWLKTRPEIRKMKVGLDISTETELLMKYQKEQKD